MKMVSHSAGNMGVEMMQIEIYRTSQIWEPGDPESVSLLWSLKKQHHQQERPSQHPPPTREREGRGVNESQEYYLGFSWSRENTIIHDFRNKTGGSRVDFH